MPQIGEGHHTTSGGSTAAGILRIVTEGFFRAAPTAAVPDHRNATLRLGLRDRQLGKIVLGPGRLHLERRAWHGTIRLIASHAGEETPP